MLYTGYFAKLKTYEKAGLQPISIAGKAPDFYKGPQYKYLAPRYKMFMDWKKGKITDEDYTREYNEYLETLDEQSVYRSLTSFGDNAILLCYEPPDKFCHRHLVAEWLTNVMGIDIEEYDENVAKAEADVIEELKGYWLTEDDIRYDYNISNVESFLDRIKLNPPEGRILVSSVDDDTNERVYTLEDEQELLNDYLGE